MTDGLTMTPDGGPDLNETRGRRDLPSSGPAILQTGLVVAACAVFVIAKSIATGGRVHIDDLEYWIVGIVPVVLLYGLSGLIARVVPDVSRDPVAKRLIGTWLLTLVLFCVSKDFHVYESLRGTGETVAKLDRVSAEVGVALLLATVASLVTMTKFVWEAKHRRGLVIGTLGAVILIMTMTSLLLSWH
jgi:hypothetical protein